MTNALVNLSSPFSKAPKQSFVAYAGVADNTSVKGNIGAAYIKCLLKRCITLNNIYFLYSPSLLWIGIRRPVEEAKSHYMILSIYGSHLSLYGKRTFCHLYLTGGTMINWL
jgi:hypothetical protein